MKEVGASTVYSSEKYVYNSNSIRPLKFDKYLKR